MVCLSYLWCIDIFYNDHFIEIYFLLFTVMPFLCMKYCNAFIPMVNYSENSSF